MERDKTISPRAVEGMIAEGQTIVIFEDLILKLDSWQHKHPGGKLVIMHMVGRDATDEIRAYHSEASIKIMSAYRVGRKPAGPWTNMTPPIRGGVYRKQAASPVTLAPDSDTEVDDAISLASSECSCCDEGDSLASSVCSCEGADHIRRRVSHKEVKVSDGLQLKDELAAEKAVSRIQFADERIQKYADHDAQEFPSLDPKVQQDIVRKYRALRQTIMDDGLFNCSYIEYGKEMLRYTALFGTFLFLLRAGWYITSACFLGLFWHQIMFVTHDGAHLAITSIFAVDTLIAMFVADFCCGLSVGWWKSSHNVHHLVTNQPEHDPDIQNLPIFATCPSFFKGMQSTYYNFHFAWDAAAEFLLPYQAYTYYPIMGVARFNLYLLSWLHVLSAKSSSLGSSKAWWIRPTEILFMCCYWFIFGYCLVWRTLPTWPVRIMFVLVSHIVTMPLHVQITLSHWGMSHTKMGDTESFPQHQLRTTMDVDCPAWLDFIHGGLQFQAVHHLFPRLPRHNLRKAQAHMRVFCAETGIPYALLNFVDGNKKVLDRLQEVGDQVKIMVSCQKYMAETGESGLH